MKNLSDISIHYQVVANEEGQYSIWPCIKELPPGWQQKGFTGNKEECLDYIKNVWIDMRPRSLIKQMSLWEPQQEEELAKLKAEILSTEQSSTVTLLTNKIHQVTIKEKSIDSFKQAIIRKYVHVYFPDTQGGTCLGITIDSADINPSLGMVHLEGNVILDYVHIHCIIDIDFSSLTGKASLTKK